MKANVRPKSIIIKKIHPIVLINPAAINIPKNQAANAISIAITVRKIIAAKINTKHPLYMFYSSLSFKVKLIKTIYLV